MKRTRIAALLLALVLCLGLLPVAALAASEPELSLAPPSFADIGRPMTVMAPPSCRQTESTDQAVPGSSEQYRLIVSMHKRGEPGYAIPGLGEKYPEGTVINAAYDATPTTGCKILSITGGSDPSYENAPDGSASFQVRLTGDVEVDVEWYPLDKDFSITFVPNGAGEPYTVPMKNGSTLTLPEDPVLPGYRFLGWYGGVVKGRTLGNSYSVSDDPGMVLRDATYYAMWEKVEEDKKEDDKKEDDKKDPEEKPPVSKRWKVYFWIRYAEKNGRFIKLNGKDVPDFGPDHEPYQLDEDSGVDFKGGYGWTTTNAEGRLDSLPTAVMEGKEFGYWYYHDGTGFVPISTETVLTKDTTVYSYWEDPVRDKTLSQLAYKFLNTRSSFGYPSTYRIPLETFEMMYGDTARARVLYEHFGTWGGSCYGMSTTATMFYQKGASTSAFRSDAQRPYDLKVGDRNRAWGFTLQEFIEAMQISSAHPDIKSGYGVSAVCKALSGPDPEPIIIVVYDGTVGHAVVGYQLVNVSPTQDKILIYDPNRSTLERSILVSKNGSEYTGWDFEWKYHSRNPNAGIYYDPYPSVLSVWNNRGSRSNSAAQVNLLHVASGDAEIKDAGGTTVATVKNGTLTALKNDVRPIINIGNTADGQAPESVPAAWVPADEAYTLVKTSSKKLEASLVNVDQSAAVSTSASEVTLAVNDGKALNYVQINQPGASYDISLSSTLDQGHKEVKLTGKTASGAAAFAQIGESLYGTGAGAGAKLNVDGKDTAVSALSAGMPDVGGVLSGTVKPSAPKPSAPNPFKDVASSSPFYDAIAWAVEKGITNGTTPTTFAPGTTCTTGHILTFLWRSQGSPEPTIANPFKDEIPGAFQKAAIWAHEKGLVSGDTFGSAAPCTRAASVTYMWKLAGSPEAKAASFKDVDASSDYAKAISWAVEKGVTNGTGDGTTFSPENTCTRGQIVTFLYRAYAK